MFSLRSSALENHSSCITSEEEADDSAGMMDTGVDSYNILIYIDKQNIDGKTMDRISAAGYVPVDRTAIDRAVDKERLIIIRIEYLFLIILASAAGCMFRR